MGAEPITERRVQFDFEVDFSNGGRLQEHDFRLDIEGEDFPEEALARKKCRTCGCSSSRPRKFLGSLKHSPAAS